MVIFRNRYFSIFVIKYCPKNFPTVLQFTFVVMC